MRWVFMRTLATVVVVCLVGPFVRNALADKIVVYGASGSVGRVIVEEALSRGHEVIGVSRNPESLKFDNVRFTAAPGDVTDPDDIDIYRALGGGWSQAGEPPSIPQPFVP